MIEVTLRLERNILKWYLNFSSSEQIYNLP